MIDQMEFGLGTRGKRRGIRRRVERQRRAQWWFARMRSVVDGALEWRPAPRARPEQVYMPLEAAER